VIFRSGEGALQVLPQLLGVVPEARLNLALYYLRQGELPPSLPSLPSLPSSQTLADSLCVCV